MRARQACLRPRGLLPAPSCCAPHRRAPPPLLCSFFDTSNVRRPRGHVEAAPVQEGAPPSRSPALLSGEGGTGPRPAVLLVLETAWPALPSDVRLLLTPLVPPASSSPLTVRPAVEGRTHSVQVHYRETPAQDYLQASEEGRLRPFMRAPVGSVAAIAASLFLTQLSPPCPCPTHPPSPVSSCAGRGGGGGGDTPRRPARRHPFVPHRPGRVRGRHVPGPGPGPGQGCAAPSQLEQACSRGQEPRQQCPPRYNLNNLPLPSPSIACSRAAT